MKLSFNHVFILVYLASFLQNFTIHKFSKQFRFINTKKIKNNYFQNFLSMEEEKQDMEEQKQELANQKDIKEAFIFSQFITTIKVINSEEDFKQMLQIQKDSVQLQKDVTSMHFRELAIQFFYFLYGCSHLNIVPNIQDQRILCYDPKNNSVILCLQKKFLKYQHSFLKNKNLKYFEYYQCIMEQIIQFWKAVQKKTPNKHPHLTANNFQSKIKQVAEKQYKTEKQSFNSLEKQRIFIQTSILLRIRNCALVCIFRKNVKLMQHYKKHRIQEQTLSQEYNTQNNNSNSRKKNQAKLLQIQKKIQKNIQGFFTKLQTNPKNQKLDEKRKSDLKSMNGQTINKLYFQLKIYQLMDLRDGNELNEEYYNKFEIQYNTVKSNIVVRMLTDLILDWATSDSLLYKWNTLTFQTSNVGLQTIQKTKSDAHGTKVRLVVIRGTSYFNRGQPVLQKILTLIDLTMATYKSIELEMSNQNVFAKTLGRIQETYAKINHYLRTIQRCCVRSYGSVVEDI